MYYYGKKDFQDYMKIEWLILMACQPIKGYFMPNS